MPPRVGGITGPVALPAGARRYLARETYGRAPGRRAPFIAARAAAPAEAVAANTTEAAANHHGRRSAAARGGPRATRRARGAHHTAQAAQTAETGAPPATGAGKATRAERGAATPAPAEPGAAAPPRGASRTPTGARHTATQTSEPRAGQATTNRSRARAEEAAHAGGGTSARMDERNSRRGYGAGRTLDTSGTLKSSSRLRLAANAESVNEWEAAAACDWRQRIATLSAERQAKEPERPPRVAYRAARRTATRAAGQCRPAQRVAVHDWPGAFCARIMTARKERGGAAVLFSSSALLASSQIDFDSVGRVIPRPLLSERL